MKQVQLWIAVCPFDERVVVEVKDRFEVKNKHKKFLEKIIDAITPKVWIDEMLNISYLRENESYESLLEALWQLQKSLLPDGYYIDCPTPEWIVDEPVMISNGKERLVEFYNPSSRVICITDLEQEADQ